MTEQDHPARIGIFVNSQQRTMQVEIQILLIRNLYLEILQSLIKSIYQVCMKEIFTVTKEHEKIFL